MNFADKIKSELPRLRRYGRAITGSRKAGDDAVLIALETIDLEASELSESSSDPVILMFRAVDRWLRESLQNANLKTDGPDPLTTLAMPERRALILTAVEEFAAHEVAAIMEIPEAELDACLAASEDKLVRGLATDALIIEDEPLIAANLKRLVESLGHTVVGLAQTYDEAVELGERLRPPLILSDVKLADGSLGYDAIEQIETHYAPVTIYITAYPEQLLQGAEKEPAHLIPKPFKPSYVKAVIEQALLSRI